MTSPPEDRRQPARPSLLPAPPRPEDGVLSLLSTAIWIYDFDNARIVWANPAALALWDADTLELLTRRDMRSEMSTSVTTRLEQHQEDFDRYPEREISELWTLYPQNHPVRVQATLRRYEVSPGRYGMLVEARREEVSAPETIRSADALLHAQTIIALFDQSGRALYGNPAFRATFGPGPQVFGREFASPADLLDCLEGIERHGEHRTTTLVYTRNGTRWLDIHAVRCKDAVTGDGAFLATMLDVTEAREHQHALREARDTAETAMRARSQFLAVMSHELRTPLNGILGMSNLLAGSELDGAQRRMVDVVSQSGELMLNIVENILRLIEIESGKLNVSMTEFDPVLLKDAVVEGMRGQIEAKGLAVLSSARFDGPVRYRHDPDLLKQVLRILIANAMKFTDRGFVTVRVGPGETGGLRFEVGDTGPGIPEEHLDRIFECFHQVDGSSTRHQGGTGIGLAIARAIVGQWQGTIGVKSEVGRGSVFSFDVPAAPVVEEGGPNGGGGERAFHLKIVP